MTTKLMSSLLILLSVLLSGSLFAQDQNRTDDKILQDYFAANKIKPSITPSGLYYLITTPGTGENCKRGQKVTMSYRGKLIDGKLFDGNVDENFKLIQGRQPFTFNLGMGQVIRGWDEGVQLLKMGSRGTLYIPSSLGYGAAGAGGVIPPNAVLIFDVEVTAVN